MKGMRRLFTGLALAATLIVTGFSFPAEVKAAYTYTVELSLAGSGSEKASYTSDALDSVSVERTVAAQSTFGNGYNKKIEGDKLVITGLQYGDRVDVAEKDMISLAPVETTDADGNTVELRKYVVSGIRKSGANDKVSGSSFEVTKDASYVVAYGVGTVVPYTVRYVDASGKALREADTYYGLLNQETYVSYKYVDGYVPNAYNYRVVSLKENQEIVFTYTPGSISNTTTTVNDGTSYNYSYVNGATTYDYQTVNNPVATGGAGGGGNGANAGDNGAGGAGGAGNNGGAGGQAGDADNAGAGDDSTAIEDEATPTAPEDTITIEDEAVSKAGGLSETTTIYVVICIIVILLAVMVFVVAFVLMKKRQKAALAAMEEQEKREE